MGFLGPYCARWNLYSLLTQGFGGVAGKVTSRPAKHRRSFLGHIINSTFTTQGETAGAQAIRSVFASLPSPLRKTITFDNGSEFALHQAIARDSSINVYFAHPYSSFERGRIENANGLLRQYLPKTMSFSGLSTQHLAPIVNELNDRPRKKQAYRTPNEVI